MFFARICWGFILIISFGLTHQVHAQFGGWDFGTKPAIKESLSQEDIQRLNSMNIYGFSFESMDSSMAFYEGAVIILELERLKKYRVWVGKKHELKEKSVLKFVAFRAGGFQLILNQDPEGNIIESIEFGFPPRSVFPDAQLPQYNNSQNNFAPNVELVNVLLNKENLDSLESQLNSLGIGIKDLLETGLNSEEISLATEIQQAVEEPQNNERKSKIEAVANRIQTKVDFEVFSRTLSKLVLDTNDPHLMSELYLELLTHFAQILDAKKLDISAIEDSSLVDVIHSIQMKIHNYAVTAINNFLDIRNDIIAKGFNLLVENVFIGYDPNRVGSSLFGPSIDLLERNKVVFQDKYLSSRQRTAMINLLVNEIEDPKLPRRKPSLSCGDLLVGSIDVDGSQ